MTYTRKISKKLVCFILAAVLLCGTHVLDAAKAENMAGYDYVYFPENFSYNTESINHSNMNITITSNGSNNAYLFCTSFFKQGSGTLYVTVSSNSSNYCFNNGTVSSYTGSAVIMAYLSGHKPPYGTSYSVNGLMTRASTVTAATIGCKVKG